MDKYAAIAVIEVALPVKRSMAVKRAWQSLKEAVLAAQQPTAQSKPCSHDWQPIPTQFGMYYCTKCRAARV